MFTGQKYQVSFYLLATDKLELLKSQAREETLVQWKVLDNKKHFNNFIKKTDIYLHKTLATQDIYNMNQPIGLPFDLKASLWQKQTNK